MTPLEPRAFDLLCLTVAATLLAHAPHLPAWISLPLALLLALRWWQRRRLGFRIPSWVKLPLVALLILAVVAAWGTPLGREPGSALAVGLLVLKLLESERRRDARSGVTFACFTLMSALLFTQSLVATVLVMLGLLPALACLRALENHAPATGWTAHLWPQLRVLAIGLPLALLAFLFVPRLSSPLWGAPQDEARTGLSRRMAPGDLTDLLIDDRTAMRVEFDGNAPPNAQRYFRAYVMWYFDGRGWEVGDFLQRTPDDLQALDEIGYRIDLEPTGQRVIPALDIVTAAIDDTRLGDARELLARRPIGQPLHVELRAATRYRLGTTLDPRARQRALQIPPSFNPRSRELAADWRQRLDNDDAIVRTALDLIRDGGFTYTLAPAPLGRDSIDDFLFDVREGFCEHFASSFAFLMRAAGIPARVVTGYQGGDWNRLGDYLQVRYSDAHAWVEVWLGERGWVRVDPTAAVRPERISLGAAAAAGRSAAWYQTGWLRAAGNRWDLINRWWSAAVIGFNAFRQRGLLQPFGIHRAEAGQLALILAAGCVLLLTIATWWALRRTAVRDPLQRAQRELESWLAHHGVARRGQEGPRDYFSRARLALPAHARQLEALAARYIELRYGQSGVTPAQVAAYRRAVREFQRRGVVK